MLFKDITFPSISPVLLPIIKPGPQSGGSEEGEKWSETLNGSCDNNPINWGDINIEEIKSMHSTLGVNNYNANTGGESKASDDISFNCSEEAALIEIMSNWKYNFQPSFIEEIKHLIAILDVDTLSKIKTECGYIVLELAVDYALESENSEILEALLKKA